MVTCQICNKQFRVISNTHLKKHDMTQVQYFEQFPGVAWKDADLNERQSIFMKKRWQDPIYCAEIKRLTTGKKRSEETKRKIGDGNRGEKNGNYGKICTPEETEFRRQIASNWERTPEYSILLSKALSAHWESEEARQALSKTLISYWEVHEHHWKGGHHTEETCLAIGIAKKKAWADGVYDGVFTSPNKPEKVVMQVLSNLGIDYEFNTFRLGTRIYDFFIPDLNLLIEYDGHYWHSKPKAIEVDALKDQLATEAGYALIRLKGLPNHDLTYDEIYSELGAVLSS